MTTAFTTNSILIRQCSDILDYIRQFRDVTRKLHLPARISLAGLMEYLPSQHNLKFQRVLPNGARNIGFKPEYGLDSKTLSFLS